MPPLGTTALTVRFFFRIDPLNLYFSTAQPILLTRLTNLPHPSSSRSAQPILIIYSTNPSHPLNQSTSSTQLIPIITSTDPSHLLNWSFLFVHLLNLFASSAQTNFIYTTDPPHPVNQSFSFTQPKPLLTDFSSWFQVYHIACLFSSPDSEQFKSKIGINRYSPC